MELVKNHAVKIAAAGLVILALGYYISSRRTKQQFNKIYEKQVILDYPKLSWAQINERFDSIFKRKVSNFSQESKLTQQEQIIVLQYLSYKHHKSLSDGEQSNITLISQNKHLSQKEILNTVIGNLERQQAKFRIEFDQQQNVLKFLNINIERTISQRESIYSSIADLIYPGLSVSEQKFNKNMIKLSKISIKKRIQFIKSLNQQLLNAIKEVVANRKSQEQLSLIPFALHLIIAEATYSADVCLRNNSVKINIATKKYKEDLRQQLALWQKQVNTLLTRLNIKKQ